MCNIADYESELLQIKVLLLFPNPEFVTDIPRYTSNKTISQSLIDNPSFCTFSKSVAIHTEINSGWLKLKVSAADTAASSQAIILAHKDSMVGKQFQVVLLLLLFPTSGRLKNPWN